MIVLGKRSRLFCDSNMGYFLQQDPFLLGANMGDFRQQDCFVSRSFAEEVFTEQRFHQLHKQLQPAADELWRTIPWRTSLLAAQQRAIAEKKPIFIWAMDGHPLGCT